MVALTRLRGLERRHLRRLAALGCLAVLTANVLLFLLEPSFLEPVGSPTSLLCVASVQLCFRQFRHACLGAGGASLPGRSVVVGNGHNLNEHFFHGTQRFVPAAGLTRLLPDVRRLAYAEELDDVSSAALSMARWLLPEGVALLSGAEARTCYADMVWVGEYEPYVPADVSADGRHVPTGLPVQVVDKENALGPMVRAAAYEHCEVPAPSSPTVTTILARGNSRDFADPSALLREVKQHTGREGELYSLGDGPGLCETVRQMARSSLVVSPHGAQCLNGMFLREGARFAVVDIFPLYNYNPFRRFIELAGAEVLSFKAEEPGEWFWAPYWLWWRLTGVGTQAERVEYCAPSYACRSLGKRSALEVDAIKFGDFLVTLEGAPVLR